MGIFDKFKKQVSLPKETVNLSERISIFDTDYPIDKSNWFQVYSACLGKATVIQNACAGQVVKNRDWNADFEKGILAFGKDTFPVQFIGSESSSGNSWMWGWNNINGFGDRLIKLAEETRELGEKWNLEPLMTERFSLDDTFNAHNLSIVTCGISKEDYCYYRGPHAGGAVLMAFSNVPAFVFYPVDAPEFTTTVMNCIQQKAVEHKIFVESFLMWNGTKYEWEGDKIIAHFSVDLAVFFEKAGEFERIASIKSI